MYGIVQPGTLESVLEQAYDSGLVGDGYTWDLPGIDALTDQDFPLDRKAMSNEQQQFKGRRLLDFELSQTLDLKHSFQDFRQTLAF
jgi:hypothetical protein